MNIYIYCDGGFGNRFNVLLSGLYLAEQINHEPIIIWQPNNWCGAELNDLFSNEFSLLNNFNRFEFFKQSITALIHENQFGQSIDFQDPRQFDSIETVKKYIQTKPYQPIIYFTNIIPQWVDMNYVCLNLLPKLKFQDDIILSANSVLKSVQQDYYGIHLRMTDFAQRDDSNVVRYYEFAKSQPDRLFFVCSDDPKVEQHFAELSNVFTNTKTSYVGKLVKDQEWNYGITDSNNNYFNFNVDRSKQSVKEAIVDLIILSRSTILNTNPTSTFLQTAFLLQKDRKISQ